MEVSEKLFETRLIHKLSKIYLIVKYTKKWLVVTGHERLFAAQRLRLFGLAICTATSSFWHGSINFI